MPIRLPPLRERTEDIPELARHFLYGAAAKACRPKRIDPGAMDRLNAYRWPGNVRELENLIRRLAALVPQPVITEAILAQELADYAVAEEPQAASGDEADTMAAVVERHVPGCSPLSVKAERKACSMNVPWPSWNGRLSA